MRAGSYVNGELWLRCPYCGDSQRHPWKAHYSINADGSYFCYRCSAGGRLSTKDRINLFSKLDIDYGLVTIDEKEDWRTTWSNVLPGPGSTRQSLLPRYHLLSTNGFFDIFESRTIPRDLGTKGKRKGFQRVNLRTNKKRIFGERKFGIPRGVGYSFSNSFSSPGTPWILVEGPYDVQEPNTLCTFGIPTSAQLKALVGQFIILYPDGDIWSKEKHRLLQSLQRTVASARNLFVVEVRRITDESLDPEQKPAYRCITVEEFLAWR